MASHALTREERLGLGVAVVLHAALVALLLIQPRASDPPPIPERMTVSLAEDVGPVAVSPDPVAESRAAIAPTLSEDPAPLPVLERPEPAELERPAPRPRPRATSAPRREEPRREPEPRRTSRPEPRESRNSGGSRIGENFLSGSGDSTTTEEARSPAATFGRSERAALASAITRQLRPHWSAPSGVDAELLVSVIAWELNSDGTLKGRPRLVAQRGVNASNRPQAALHAERAIRAIQLAAPFDLPSQFYDRWDDLEWDFDRRL